MALRTTDISLNTGRYLVSVSSALGWPAANNVSKDQAASSQILECDNNCSIALVKGWYNEPHSSNMTNGKYNTIGMQTRTYYVVVTTNNTSLTASVTTGYGTPADLGQAITLTAIKLP